MTNAHNFQTKKTYWQAMLLIVLVVIITIAGIYAGQHYLHHQLPPHQHSKANALNEYLHQQLNMTADQNQKLAPIEEDYQQQLQVIESKLQRANTELALAIQKENQYGPRIEQAITDIHTAMGELQKVTIQHFFIMQTALTPEQNLQMQKIITDVLHHSQS